MNAPVDPAEHYHEASKYHEALLGPQLSAYRAYTARAEKGLASPDPHRVFHDPEPVPLPKPYRLRARLEDALAQRRSGPLGHGPISLRQLATLLAAGFGETRDGRRAAPSAGALYPLEVYVAAPQVEGLEAVAWHLDAQHARLERVPGAEDVTPASWLLGEEGFGHAAAFIVVAAMLPRITTKYGLRGYRFALLEAGHVVQNLQLAAAALRLTAVPVGGFYDDRVHDALGMDGIDEIVLYVVPVGPRA